MYKAELELSISRQMIKRHAKMDTFDSLLYENETSELFDIKSYTETWDDMVNVRKIAFILTLFLLPLFYYY